jgi:hypothetical protein
VIALSMATVQANPAFVVVCTHLEKDGLAPVTAAFPNAKIIGIEAPELALTAMYITGRLRPVGEGEVALVAHHDCPVLPGRWSWAPVEIMRTLYLREAASRTRKALSWRPLPTPDVSALLLGSAGLTQVALIRS